MTQASRRWWRAVGLLLGLAVATLCHARDLSLARLEADPVPAQVLSGALDRDFVAAPRSVIREPDSSPHWWRITSDQAVDPATRPQLVLRSPYLNRVEVWLPGRAVPLQLALIGAGADARYSTRALVAPLPTGLAAGEPIYLRVQARSGSAMPVSIDPLAEVHRADMAHVAWRTVVLTSLLVLAVLAAGFWIGIREASYGYLCLTLLAQFCYLVTSGGEIRLVPWLADAIGGDVRINRLFGLLAIVSSTLFLAHYLELRARQPRLMRVFNGCNIAAAGLMAATLVSESRYIALAANIVLLVATASVFVACAVGTSRRQRAAYFLLLSWLPVLVLVVMRVGELLGSWNTPPWTSYGLPAALTLSGLVIMIGLTDELQQLRRDRDQASRLATYDALTGALSRPAIEQRLKAAVEEAHKSGRPVSVVFFDIDKFKRVNDEFGHRVGDNFLRIVALRTRNRLRTYDLLGRWGGDEMIVVLPDTRLGEALGVAENLRSAVNCRPLSIDGSLFDASLSLGVAELAAGESAEHLLERADSGLYMSKSAGRDRVTGHDPRVTGNHPRFIGTASSDRHERRS